MNKLQKLLVGLIVAAAVAISLGIVATAAQSTATSEPAAKIIRIASDPTNTPVGAPCHGSGC